MSLPFWDLVKFASAIAGAIKFHAWWKDRKRQKKIDSALYFKEKGGAKWERNMGARESTKLHFDCLHDINRDTGHEAISRLIERLGANTGVVGKLKRVGSYLNSTGHVAYVRKLHTEDFVETGLTTLLGLFSLTALGKLLGCMGPAIAETTWSAVGLPELVLIIGLTAYASFLTTRVVSAALEASRTMHAIQLRREHFKRWVLLRNARRPKSDGTKRKL